MSPSLREDLRDLAAYRSPRIEAPVRLNTNECPYPPPEGFVRDLAEAVAGIDFRRYPDPEAWGLRRRLAEHEDHPPEGVWAANGSNEVLQHLCLAYGGPGRRALVFEPTYALHSLIPRVLGMEVIEEPLAEDFSMGPDQVTACRGHRPDIAFVCSPNNPTGNAQDPEAVAALCEATEGLVIVDEAYVEFGGRSVVGLLSRHPNLVVVRTFSKAFSLAAARVGYCLAAPEVVEPLSRVRLPYHLSALAQAAGEVALRHAGEAEGLLRRVREQRDRLLEALARAPRVRPYPSQANFVLFRAPGSATRLWERLLARGVLVRDVSGFPGLGGCLRVSAGTPEETGAFVDALGGALEEGGG